MARRYFTVEEAEAQLPSISPLLLRAKRLKRRLEQHEHIVQRVTADGREELFDEVESFDTEYETLKEMFYDLVERIEQKGCIVRSVDEGIIDFYTRFEGRDVFLTWKLGEKKVNYWHEIDDDPWNRNKILEIH